MILFSIIVPVYNVEKHLSKCLDSIINQTYKNIEIICVNDGSNDNSLNILEQYAEKDSRIKIINQENGGVASARNAGIKASSGEYIWFIDSDDWIEANACEVLNNYIVNNDTDLINFNFYRVKDGKKSKVTHGLSDRFTEKTYNFFDIQVDICKKIYTNCWNSCFKAKLLKDNNIFFPEKFNLCEDILFVIKCFLLNPQIFIINDYLYNYLTDRKNSLTKASKLRIYQNYNKVFPELKSYINEKNYNTVYIYYDGFLGAMLSYWKDLYFSEYKNEYLTEIKNVINEYLNDTELNNKLNCSHLKRAKRRLLLVRLHLCLIYFYFIRPFMKYCVVLPYRKIKSLIRSKNGK